MKRLVAIVLALVCVSGAVFAGSHSKKSEGTTLQQYLKQAEARFKRMDANNDGVLTQAEKKAYWAKVKEQQAKKKEQKKK